MNTHQFEVKRGPDHCYNLGQIQIIPLHFPKRDFSPPPAPVPALIQCCFTTLIGGKGEGV